MKYGELAVWTSAVWHSGGYIYWILMFRHKVLLEQYVCMTASIQQPSGMGLWNLFFSTTAAKVQGFRVYTLKDVYIAVNAC